MTTHEEIEMRIREINQTDETLIGSLVGAGLGLLLWGGLFWAWFL